MYLSKIRSKAQGFVYGGVTQRSSFRSVIDSASV